MARQRDLRWLLIGAGLAPGPAGWAARQLLKRTGTPQVDRTTHRYSQRVQEWALRRTAGGSLTRNPAKRLPGKSG